MTRNSDELPRQPIACDLTAIDGDGRDRHLFSLDQLFGLVEEARELPDGYAFRLPNDADTFIKVAQVIANERKCCPFFNFNLTLAANDGPLWWQLTGTADVKLFLQDEICHRLSDAVVWSAEK